MPAGSPPSLLSEYTTQTCLCLCIYTQCTYDKKKNWLLHNELTFWNVSMKSISHTIEYHKLPLQFASWIKVIGLWGHLLSLGDSYYPPNTDFEDNWPRDKWRRGPRPQGVTLASEKWADIPETLFVLIQFQASTCMLMCSQPEPWPLTLVWSVEGWRFAWMCVKENVIGLR